MLSYICDNPRLASCIKFHTIQYPNGYQVITYTPKTVNRKQTEDELYAKNPELLDVLFRAHSVVLKDGELVGKLEGVKKFSGRTELDEDPEDLDNAEEKVSTGIFDEQKINKWHAAGDLEIVETTKENGKFAIVKLMKHNNEVLIVGGSKNKHVVTTIDTIDETIAHENEITGGILKYLKHIYPCLVSSQIGRLMLEEDYSLLGEYCDGHHFESGDESVYFFGLFKHGLPMEPLTGLALLQQSGIQTVKCTKLDITPQTNLETVFKLTRCRPGEGAVMYLRNTRTGEQVLVKSKSAAYIVKRMMRQIIFRGYEKLEDVRKRIMDVHDYHNLSTAAAVRLTKQLIDFGLWLMNHDYPCSIVSNMPIEALRGTLPPGFHTYWTKYIADGNEEIQVTEQDFGPFDSSEYLRLSELYPNRDLARAPMVIFLQGLQGSGKSTLAFELTKTLPRAKHIEQDLCYGDTKACQGQLYHYASSGQFDHIIVSRCNVNESQYSRYVDLAHRLKCRVLFLAPFGATSESYFAMSFAGIFNRSREGDSLMVGRTEVAPASAYEFTRRNFDDFQRHPNAIEYMAFNPVPNFPKLSLDEIRARADELMALRLPLEEVTREVTDLIRSADSRHFVKSDQRFRYIAFVLSAQDKATLEKFIDDQFGADPTGFDYFCEHVTQLFNTDKTKTQRDPTAVVPVPEFDTVRVVLDRLHIDPRDQSCAFGVKLLQHKVLQDVRVESGVPHVTGRMAKGRRAVEARVVIQENPDNVIPCHFDFMLTCMYR